jgi:methylase of polypeptide subunit release factors
VTEHLAFGSLTIAFDDRVLRPRDWTTSQSEWVARLSTTAPGGAVLELCAGAGHIGLLAVASTGRQLVCVDASGVACDYARANALAAGLADRVEVREGRLEEAIGPDETFPLVIADPPWVPREQTGRYPEDPLSAIDGGDDGLDVARACLAVIDAHLAPGGSAVLQVGTREQVDVLRGEPCFTEGRLAVVEVRQQERGVLARIDRA